MIYLLSPIYLWGLLGLLIPITIHLWSRKTYTTISWPVIKFIPESTSKKAATIHWEDTFLFLIRVLIIIFLVFILTNPVIKSDEGMDKRSIVLIAPELQFDPSFSSILDTLKDKENVYLLNPGFPELKENPIQNKEDVNYWGVLKTLPAEELKEVTIFSPSHYKNFKGNRPSLLFPVNWYVWSIETKDIEVISASLKSNLKGTVKEQTLSFSKVKKGEDSVKVITYFIDSLLTEPYVNDGIKALINVLSEYVHVDQTTSVDADIIFTVQDINSTSLIIKVDKERMMVEPFQKVNGAYHIPQSAFKIENMINTDLVLKFFKVLIASNLLPEQEILKNDYREMPLSQLQPGSSESKYNNEYSFIYLSSYLWILLIILIIIERITVMKQAR